VDVFPPAETAFINFDSTPPPQSSFSDEPMMNSIIATQQNCAQLAMAWFSGVLPDG
jgi:hypothetical protein